eukprot:TRINITY_DN6750_c0_g1_i1.p1 TRINITY_DN6750_c0_g1~~TRINITY_DN6750_c0_g1_i1.p1  ORF type:complete len:1079 (-),score=170.15 TRINITY_DN6750_c0_g1_i1:260-3130(-)
MPAGPIVLGPKTADSILELRLSTRKLDTTISTPDATLRCTFRDLFHYGAPLFTSMWVGLDPGGCDDGTLESALARAGDSFSPKVHMRLFMPKPAKLGDAEEPDVVRSLIDTPILEKDLWSSCHYLGTKDYRVSVVQGLIRCLGESNELVHALMLSNKSSNGPELKEGQDKEHLKVLAAQTAKNMEEALASAREHHEREIMCLGASHEAKLAAHESKHSEQETKLLSLELELERQSAILHEKHEREVHGLSGRETDRWRIACSEEIAAERAELHETFQLSAAAQRATHALEIEALTKDHEKKCEAWHLAATESDRRYEALRENHASSLMTVQDASAASLALTHENHAREVHRLRQELDAQRSRSEDIEQLRGEVEAKAEAASRMYKERAEYVREMASMRKELESTVQDASAASLALTHENHTREVHRLRQELDAQRSNSEDIEQLRREVEAKAEAASRMDKERAEYMRETASMRKELESKSAVTPREAANSTHTSIIHQMLKEREDHIQEVAALKKELTTKADAASRAAAHLQQKERKEFSVKLANLRKEFETKTEEAATAARADVDCRVKERIQQERKGFSQKLASVRQELERNVETAKRSAAQQLQAEQERHSQQVESLRKELSKSSEVGRKMSNDASRSNESNTHESLDAHRKSWEKKLSDALEEARIASEIKLREQSSCLTAERTARAAERAEMEETRRKAAQALDLAESSMDEALRLHSLEVQHLFRAQNSIEMELSQDLVKAEATTTSSEALVPSLRLKGSKSPLESKIERIILRLFRCVIQDRLSGLEEESVKVIESLLVKRSAEEVQFSRQEIMREVRRGFIARRGCDVRRLFRKLDPWRTGFLNALQFIDVMQGVVQLDRGTLCYLFSLLDSASRSSDTPRSPKSPRTSVQKNNFMMESTSSLGVSSAAGSTMLSRPASRPEGMMGEEDFVRLFQDPRLDIVPETSRA